MGEGKMYRYYIVFSLLWAFTIGMVVYTLSKASSTHQSTNPISQLSKISEQATNTSSSTSSASASSLEGLASVGGSSTLIKPKCGTTSAVYELKDITTVKSVNTSQGIIMLDTAGEQLTSKNNNPIKTLNKIKYDSITSIYGSKCQKLTVSSVNSLKAGASITIYSYDQSSQYADQLEL